MPGSYETPRTTSSVLKTTTWGALIALSGAIFVAGVSATTRGLILAILVAPPLQ